MNFALPLLMSLRNQTEELVTSAVASCYFHLARLALIPKDLLIKSFMELAPLLLHPNGWIHRNSLRFCELAYRSMTDAEIFCRIRTPFKRYLQNRILLMSHTDEFKDFVIPSESRIVVDLTEALGDTRGVTFIPRDLDAKAIIEKNVGAFRFSDALPERKDDRARKYMDYLITLESVKKVAPVRAELVVTEDEDKLFGGNTVTNNASATKKKAAGQPVVLYQPRYMCEDEVQDYIDTYYYPHEVPSRKGYMLNNNGLNNDYAAACSKGDRRPLPYKQMWLRRALHLYCAGDKSSSCREQLDRRYRLAVPHQWNEWKPTGHLIVTLYNHKAPVSSIATSENSNVMATGSSDGTCYIWNMAEIERDIDINPINKIEIKNKIRTLRCMDGGSCILLGTDQGNLYFSRLDRTGTNGIFKEIRNTQEGGIVDACPLNYSNGQNVIVYATQRGVIHMHDLRVKKDVNNFVMDCQRGIITSACLGNDDYSFFVGTLGGCIGIYDIRFNLMSSLRKYSCETPVSDICTYSADFTGKESSQYVFAAPGTDVTRLDLFQLTKEAAEWSFVAGSQVEQGAEVIRTELKNETMHYTDPDLVILKRLVKSVPIEEEVIIEDQLSVCGLAKLYTKAKVMYGARNRLTRILCPRLSREGVSAPFLLTAGADGVIRYLYFGALNPDDMRSKSSIITSPDDRTCKYVVDSTEGLIREYQETAEDKKLPLRSGAANGTFEIGSGVKYKIANPNHSDAILDMALLDLPFDTFLVTCGRDNTVKIWT